MMEKWMRFIIALCSIVLLLCGCSIEKEASTEINQNSALEQTDVIQEETEGIEEVEPEHVTEVKEEKVDEEKIEAEEIEEIDIAMEMLDQMTLEEQVAQLYFVSLSTYKKLGNPPVGGVIYFNEDMTSIEAIHEETASLQAQSKIPMFISIDEEGGIVSRLTGKHGIGATTVPEPWTLGEMNNLDHVYAINEIIASELNALGFNMNFSPVGDIWTNPDNKIIGKRAYSDDAKQVADYVVEAIKAYKDDNIIPVVKHFPGHGDTLGDSHKEAVHVNHTYDRLMSTELVPFSEAFEHGCDIVMVGHIKVPNVDNSGHPASLSKRLIDGILKEDLGFEGIVISDALNMLGIANYYSNEQVVELGLEAGLDMFLMPEDYDISYEHLLDLAESDEQIREQVKSSVYKILTIKDTYGLLENSRDRVPLEDVGSEAHKKIVENVLESY